MDILGPKSGERWGKYFTINKNKTISCLFHQREGQQHVQSQESIDLCSTGVVCQVIISHRPWRLHVQWYISHLTLPCSTCGVFTEWTVTKAHGEVNSVTTSNNELVSLDYQRLWPSLLKTSYMGARLSSWLVVQSRNNEVPMAKAGWWLVSHMTYAPN